MSSDQSDAEFMAELQEDMVEELSDALASCEELAMEYERSEDGSCIIEMKRILHSMKGSAHSACLKVLAAEIHTFESRGTRAEMKDAPSLANQVLKEVDRLRHWLTAVEEGSTPLEAQEVAFPHSGGAVRGAPRSAS